jgi:hypothetical protein
MPEQLYEEELADWRAGRDAIYQLAALTVGVPSLTELVGNDTATPSIYDAEGMVSTWTQRSSCHSSNPAAPVFVLMRRAITMASASFPQATRWI